MHKINTTTKKFTEAVTIDLGQLPVIDAKIDFQLTDGSNPVIAENKTFAMTIGTVEGTLYKTDNDTVSFRYLKFNDDNIADSLVITMTMDGEEILNDTVSMKYQRECVDKDALEEAINAKADKATTIAGYGITDAYTKTEIDAKVSSVYHYRGTVSTYTELPASGQEVGDVWNIETADSTHGIKAGDNVAWTGTEWDVLAGTVDLTPYATKDELSTGLSGKADSSHTHAMGDITGLVAALARKQDSELAIESASGTALAVLPGKAYSWTLSGNGTLSLGDGWEAGSLSDSVILLSPGSYSVSCSGNLTMVDPLQAGKMNLCVVRWLGDRARLYVVDSEQPGTITAQPVTASGTVGTAMSVNLADYVTVSTGANASYAMASGSTLPSGLSLSSEGVLSGTPEAESSDSLTVDVTAAGCTPTTLALTMAITAASTP